jgi:hypothetical protein
VSKHRLAGRDLLKLPRRLHRYGMFSTGWALSSLLTAHVRSVIMATEVTPIPSDITWTGRCLPTVVPSPSWPEPLLRQRQSVRSSLIACASARCAWRRACRASPRHRLDQAHGFRATRGMAVLGWRDFQRSNVEDEPNGFSETPPGFVRRAPLPIRPGHFR